MSIKTLTFVVTLSLFIPISAPAQTASPKQELKYGMTDLEIAMLPDYCRARLIGDERAKAPWIQSMGNDKFIHLHHYCSGLNSFNRAKNATDGRTRAAKLEFSVKELNYVIKAWPSDFFLAKEAQKMKDQAATMR